MINIKGKHILIMGAGYTIKKYWDEVEKFIKDNDVVTIGCNHIMNIIVPDIHLWGSSKRFRQYGHLTSKKSSVIFQSNFKEKEIKKHWKRDYDTYHIDARLWKYGSDDKNSYAYKRCCMRKKKNIMVGCFCSAGSKAIFWSYMKGAKKISIVGMDGYTFYSKADLEADKKTQHCYGKGFSNGFNYEYNRKIDWDVYKTLRLLKIYGRKKHKFDFEIITPTVYEEFYNPNILNVKTDDSMQKWVEPTKKEYKQLYFDSKKNRVLSDNEYYDYNG